MVELRPVDALLVAQEFAASVVGPAYDALLPAERRALAAQNPDSFFNVVRSGTDHPELDAAGLLASNAAALERLVAERRYRAPQHGLFLYRLVSDDHHQTAVVGDIAVRQVTEGSVRAHERTREAKETELASHLSHLRMNSSPVGLGYRARADIDELVRRHTAEPAQLDFRTVDGLRQQVWAVTEREAMEAIETAFGRLEATYIIDGHHRVAAAARHDGEGHFLAALIPDHELRLLPYHRIVGGPLPDGRTERLAALADTFEVRPIATPPALADAASFALYLDHRWWLLRRRRPVGAELAATIGDREILGPLLGVADPRHDVRLDFVAGHRRAEEIAAIADARHGAALLLTAPSLPQVFSEADAGRALPPKSTWFEPKLRSGVFVVWR